MSIRWAHFAMAIPLVACDGRQVLDMSPKAYLTEEYFRKQRDCEARPPLVHSWNLEVDYGPPVHDESRPSVWKAQRMYLGDTCIIAHVGPYYYAEEEGGSPAAYAIDVEVRGVDTPRTTTPSYRVLFRRHFRPDDLPKGFERVEIAQIVSFSEPDRTVRFTVAGRVIEYRVPAL